MSQQRLQGEPLTILFVEDNPAHAELVIRSFEDQRVANTIHHVADGEAALDYLLRRGAYAAPADSPRPHVILLDLRLPKVDGLEVLKQIRLSAELRTLPVVVLTTSASEADAAKAYDYHANSYLVKPLDFAKFSELMEDLGFYWLGWNYYPFSRPGRD
ncbi:MAG: response regulator [Thermodesulfobacteriota bacterium]